MMHNIASARFANPGDSQAVIATHTNGSEFQTSVDSDVEGGIVAFLADGGTVGAYVEPIRSKDELLLYAADKRWQVETGGITVAGIAIPTDDRAKLLINGASLGMADTDTAMFVSGTTAAELTGAQFTAFNSAIIAHVQACFAVQSVVMADIESDTITTTAEIDAADWP